MPESSGVAMPASKPRTFHVTTMGCQMNLADSENLARRLLAAGYAQESDLDRADIAVLNTCVVRQASEDKVYSKLGELGRWKAPGRTIALTGCLVKKEGDRLKSRFPQLDAVIPIGQYDDFLADLEARYDYALGEPLPAAGRTAVSHYINVIQGCDHNCTFCIVPAVRGREVHVPMDQVLSACRAAVRDGAREVVLLGQNVDDYRDPDGGGGLASLVRRVSAIDGLRRVRFMTSHPQDLEPELLEVMASNDKVAHELQLPVQSGDDTVLRRMARGYQVRHYRAIVERARELMPEIGLYTDVIVGFPGESEEMYLNTRRLIEEIQFDVVHLAQYSPRPGTHSAEKWSDDVSADDKRRRINDLLTLQRGIAAARSQRWLGREVEVLVEGFDELGRPYGRSRQGKRVVIKGRRSVGSGEQGGDEQSDAQLSRGGDMVIVGVDSSSAGQLSGPVVRKGG
ncbi:MAG TPA: MiaB/RimO family radical SAM methylthiotransferase [Candidatus Acidoferrales bacterium]|nr:MiaB/RimO family radical SAM methylthiotransferase [Candidatus Acidoferrales bacterium]